MALIEWEKEEEKRRLKAVAAWPSYVGRTPTERNDFDDGYQLFFEEKPEKVGSCIKTPKVRFTFDGNRQPVSMWTGFSKAQLFPVINGPLAGQMAVDGTEGYSLYNSSGKSSRKHIPKCVLVHTDSLRVAMDLVLGS